MRSVLGFLILILSAASALAAPLRDVAPGHKYRLVGYVSRRTKIDRITAQNLTHINYAFAKVRGDDKVVFEDDDAPANLRRLNELRKLNPDLKIILAIGGWGAEWFSDAALTPESRCRFTSSAIELMRAHGLDGLDIDWEYPGQPGAGNRYRAADKQNFTLLLAQLRHDLDLLSIASGRKGFDRYTLTIASSGDRYFQFTEMDKVHRYLDWINVMTYDFVGGWSKVTKHHSKLAGETPSTESFVKQHLTAGVPARKIVVGVPLYGKGFRWVNRKTATGINEPYDLFINDISYARLEREFLIDPRYQQRWDPAAKAPYLWDPELGTFVTYDNARSLAEKIRYVKRLGLGGVMYWEQALDPDEKLVGFLAAGLK